MSTSMEDEVARLMSDLKFSEEEMQDMDDSEMLLKNEVPGFDKWLVGRLVSPAIVDGGMLIRVFLAVWKSQPLEDASELGPNMFLFKFQKLEDRDFVLERVPWTFNGELMALQPFDGKLSPSEYNFSVFPIWVRIYDLPLVGMTVEIGKSLGSKFGECLMADFRKGEGRLGQYMSVRVEIDITKPLRRCVMFGRKCDGSPRVCWAKYERLPKFCFWCGIIGHVLELCPSLPENWKNEQLQYGDWLRVVFKSRSVTQGAPKPGLVHFSNGGLNIGRFKKANEVVDENAIAVSNISARGRNVIVSATKNRSSKRVLQGKFEVSNPMGPKKTRSMSAAVSNTVEVGVEALSPLKTPEPTVEADAQPRREP
ncbi:hypothetical protein HRI_002671900 [Hibiscus trionum]|uniref:CCHC-type domain-containing protein n=1 Tax=Hibiscus trionum TaxID=183268 RepID=A0A9W7I7L1_HIBTR|nr:hypothetical protein HRI_002671900 [Hibiscus trionum]